MKLLTSHFRNASLAAAATLFYSLASASADQQAIPHPELDRLLTIIKPQAGESPWREIDWLTDVTEARRRALGERKRGHVRLLEKDLAPLLAVFRALPESAHKPQLPDLQSATPAKQPVPLVPENGIVVQAYCTYLKDGENGKPQRAKRLYYQRNPNAWTAETQNDMLWLTEAEWRSLIPENSSAGTEITVPKEIQRRFFSTIGIDYMEGSVDALPLRESTMTLTVEKAGQLRLHGLGKMGRTHTAESKNEARTRGCELRVIGSINYDLKEQKITAFDLAGVGEAWGNKMEYISREIGIPEPRWKYGIACELVTGSAPQDLIPPYNMQHYSSKMTDFTGE